MSEQAVLPPQVRINKWTTPVKGVLVEHPETGEAILVSKARFAKGGYKKIKQPKASAAGAVTMEEQPSGQANDQEVPGKSPNKKRTTKKTTKKVIRKRVVKQTQKQINEERT